MVPVEVRNQNRIDLVRRDVPPLHPDERRGSTIDEKSPPGVAHVEAGEQTTAAGEGIAAPEEAQAHLVARHTPPTSACRKQSTV